MQSVSCSRAKKVSEKQRHEQFGKVERGSAAVLVSTSMSGVVATPAMCRTIRRRRLAVTQILVHLPPGMAVEDHHPRGSCTGTQPPAGQSVLFDNKAGASGAVAPSTSRTVRQTATPSHHHDGDDAASLASTHAATIRPISTFPVANEPASWMYGHPITVPANNPGVHPLTAKGQPGKINFGSAANHHHPALADDVSPSEEYGVRWCTVPKDGGAGNQRPAVRGRSGAVRSDDYPHIAATAAEMLRHRRRRWQPVPTSDLANGVVDRWRSWYGILASGRARPPIVDRKLARRSRSGGRDARHQRQRW